MRLNLCKFRIALLCLLVLCSASCSKPKSKSRPDLTVIGYARMSDGLGRQSVELIDALKDEFTIDFIPTQHNIFKDVPSAVTTIIKNREEQLGKVVIFEETLWTPRSSFYEKLITPRQDDQVRIAYSMFESSRIPKKWVSVLNTYFDAVAVPDPFLIEVYQQSGVTLPIFVVPLGLDLNNFFKQPLKKERRAPFVFGNLSTCLDRKNQLTLLRAFAEAFGNDPNFELIINSRYVQKETDALLKRVIRTLGLDNVYYSHLELDKAGYLALFKKIDCYVSLSKGEGFSIQPREAMALGIPTIVTNNTGQSTICNSGLATVVSSPHLKPAFYEWIKEQCGFGYDCDVEEVTQKLKEVTNNYEEHLKKGAAAREWVQQYTYKEIKPLYKTLVSPSEVILGSENKITSTQLITNSKPLYEKYKQLTH